MKKLILNLRFTVLLLFLLAGLKSYAQPVANCQTYNAVITPNGVAVVSVQNIDNGSTGYTSLSLGFNGSIQNSITFNCSNVGQTYIVQLIAISNNGLADTCSAFITVTSNPNVCNNLPVANCQNINLLLNPNGVATLNATQLDNGSLNANSYSVLYNGAFQSSVSFNCNNIGAQTLIFYAYDSLGSGFSDTCTSIVTVIDSGNYCNNNLPVANCQNINLLLNPNGVATLNATQLDNGSLNANSYSVLYNGAFQSSVSFNCNNIGAQTLIFYAYDSLGSGFSDTCTSIVTVIDSGNFCNNNTTPNALCQNSLTFALGQNGTVTVNASQIDAGSTGGQVYLLDGNNYVNSITFNCSDVGMDTVTLAVVRIDSNGNVQTSLCNSIIYILDAGNVCGGGNTSAPQANCVSTLELNLNQSGFVVLTPQMLNNGSTNGNAMWLQDANGNYQSAYTFNCSMLGSHVFYLVVSNGNNAGTVNALIDTCAVIVNVLDSFNYCGGGQGNYTVLDSVGPSINCNGACTGFYSLNQIILANGTIAPQPYTIVWQNNSYNGLITGLCPNTTYTITIYDALQNAYQHSFVVTCNNQPNSCIDTTLLNPTANCPTNYAPVCGCNGITYINSCIAQYSAGVTSWTNGPCGGNSGGSNNYSVQTTGSGCDSSCTGSITISFPTATPNNTYTLVWNDGFTQTVSGAPTGGANIIRTNLCAGVYIATVSTNTFSAPFSITAIVGTAQGCVWPGDADDNTTVNNWDLLPIALTHGESGILRPNANISWTGQASSDWTTVNPVAGLPNYKHIDCNGDGIINQNDLTAIQQNYGSNYYRSNSSMTGNIPFFINSVNANEGDRLSLPINLGTAAEPAADVYGVAFTLNYDPEIVEASSVSVDYPVSWLGTNLLDIQYDFSQLGKIEVAVARRDRLNNSGFGEIGKFNFTIRDDILRSSTTRTMDIDITNIRLIDNANTEIGTNPQVGTVTVTLLSSTEAIDNYSVELFPNPTKDQFNVRVQNASLETVTVYNVNGQLVNLTENINSNLLTLPVNEFAPGIYMVQIKTDKGVENRKLVIE